MFCDKLRIISLFAGACVLAGVPSAQAASEVALTTTSPARSATSRRPPAFFNFMLAGAMLHEDGDNRVTSRGSSAFAIPGLAVRAGGVVGRHHLIGGMFQVNWRSTKTVLDSQGNDEKWGAVSHYYIGPEYRYIASFGLYAGGSLGFAYTLVDNHVGGGGSPDCSWYSCVREHMQETDDQGIPGVGVRAVLGYEYHVKRTLAFNVEAFGGVLHGEDEDDVVMTTPTYGLAFGVGF